MIPPGNLRSDQSLLSYGAPDSLALGSDWSGTTSEYQSMRNEQRRKKLISRGHHKNQKKKKDAM